MSAFLTPPPALTPAELQTLVHSVYGLSGAVKPLVSERDQNARIEAGDSRYVLKIANAGEDPAQIDLQNAAMAHLAQAGFTGAPQIVPTLSGDDTAAVEAGGRPAGCGW